jgi:hypothetical protein
MPNNVYSYLDGAVKNPSSQRTLNALPGGIKNTQIIKFPSSLGASVEGSSAPSIPFTIFMPYKRATGSGGFYSTKQGNDLYELPDPTFAIVLPTATSALNTQYNATYTPFDIGQGLGAAGQSLGTITDELSKGKGTSITNILVSAGQGIMSQAKIAGIAGIADILSSESDSQSGKDILNIAIGQAANPYTENMFRNMDFRKHSFEYTVLPKNPKDSQDIDRIITLFKYALLPRPGTGAVGGPAGFFDFPFEFQITHSIQDTTFTLLPSVLTSLDVDYGGGTDSPKLFRPDIDGKQYPAKIKLSLNFQEMVLLTRDRVMYDDAYAYKSSESEPSAAKRYRF